MAFLEHMGRSFPVDGEGFLTDPSLYGPEWVDLVRLSEEIDELTEDHLAFLDFLRGHQAGLGRPPRVRDMPALSGFKLKHIYELFPSGPGKGACRMAGLSKPEGCV